MGLFARFGSFASRIWGKIKSVVRPIQEAEAIATSAGVTVQPYDLVREYRHVIAKDSYEASVANVGLEQTIPHNLYVSSLVPMNKRFGYEVMISGRNLKTGQFYRQPFKMTFSREMEVGELLEVAEEYFAADGKYPTVAVTHMGVTAAFTRARDIPW